MAIVNSRGAKVGDIRENRGRVVVDRTDALVELGDLLVKTGREMRRLAYRDDLSEDERVERVVAGLMRLRILFPEEDTMIEHEHDDERGAPWRAGDEARDEKPAEQPAEQPAVYDTDGAHYDEAVYADDEPRLDTSHHELEE